MALVDASGRRARVIVPASQPALRYPIGVFAAGGRHGLRAARLRPRAAARSSRASTSRRVRAVEVRGDRSASGALLLANLELVDLTAVTPAARAR